MITSPGIFIPFIYTCALMFTGIALKNHGPQPLLGNIYLFTPIFAFLLPFIAHAMILFGSSSQATTTVAIYFLGTIILLLSIFELGIFTSSFKSPIDSLLSFLIQSVRILFILTGFFVLARSKISLRLSVISLVIFALTYLIYYLYSYFSSKGIYSTKAPIVGFFYSSIILIPVFIDFILITIIIYSAEVKKLLS